MGIATLVVSSVLSLLTLMQVAGASAARPKDGGEDRLADGVGIAVALLYAFGSMCSLYRPLLAAVVLGLAGLGGVLGGLAIGFTELAVWGSLAPVPMTMSLVNARGPRDQRGARP